MAETRTRGLSGAGLVAGALAMLAVGGGLGYVAGRAHAPTVAPMPVVASTPAAVDMGHGPSTCDVSQAPSTCDASKSPSTCDVGKSPSTCDVSKSPSSCPFAKPSAGSSSPVSAKGKGNKAAAANERPAIEKAVRAFPKGAKPGDKVSVDQQGDWAMAGVSEQGGGGFNVLCHKVNGTWKALEGTQDPVGMGLKYGVPKKLWSRWHMTNEP